VAVAGLVADPAARVTGEPKLVPSIANWMDPVGVPVPGATVATVAVKVTDWPKVEGFCDEPTAVVVDARLTTCPPVRVPRLEVKLTSPL
jgi:hypothetical protein